MKYRRPIKVKVYARAVVAIILIIVWSLASPKTSGTTLPSSLTLLLILLYPTLYFTMNYLIFQQLLA